MALFFDVGTALQRFQPNLCQRMRAGTTATEIAAHIAVEAKQAIAWRKIFLNDLPVDCVTRHNLTVCGPIVINVVDRKECYVRLRTIWTRTFATVSSDNLFKKTNLVQLTTLLKWFARSSILFLVIFSLAFGAWITERFTFSASFVTARHAYSLGSPSVTSFFQRAGEFWVSAFQCALASNALLTALMAWHGRVRRRRTSRTKSRHQPLGFSAFMVFAQIFTQAQPFWHCQFILFYGSFTSPGGAL